MAKITKNLLVSKINEINASTNLNISMEDQSLRDKKLYVISSNGKHLYTGLAFETYTFLEGIVCGISLYTTGKYKKSIDTGSFLTSNSESSGSEDQKKYTVKDEINNFLRTSQKFRVIVHKILVDSSCGDSTHHYIFEKNFYSPNTGAIEVKCTLRVIDDNDTKMKPGTFNVGTFMTTVLDCTSRREFGLKMTQKADELVFEKMQHDAIARAHLEYLLYVTDERQKELYNQVVSGCNTKIVKVIAFGNE